MGRPTSTSPTPRRRAGRGVARPPALVGTPEAAELAVCPTARAARRLRARRRRPPGAACTPTCGARLARLDGTDLFAWLARRREPIAASGAGRRRPTRRGGGRARRRRASVPPGRDARAIAAARLVREGDRGALGLERRRRSRRATLSRRPRRLWSALTAPHAGDPDLASTRAGSASTGAVTHCPGGSHGSLLAGDSLCPLLLVGLEPGAEDFREQWASATSPASSAATSGSPRMPSIRRTARRRRGTEWLACGRSVRSALALAGSICRLLAPTRRPQPRPAAPARVGAESPAGFEVWPARRSRPQTPTIRRSPSRRPGTGG